MKFYDTSKNIFISNLDYMQIKKKKTILTQIYCLTYYYFLLLAEPVRTGRSVIWNCSICIIFFYNPLL